MANASKKMGHGAQGKNDGSGAMTDMPKDMVEEDEILSNREKSQHSDERGLDTKHVQNQQGQDHSEAQLPDDER
ncbi:hypothetical protein [Amorphus orientalis]|uniref:Uncharacterized protein n=1 Tax=Amorphus orientalis TaxID=649198 RepID=A0AAE3VQJ3_9HYPH|nr:hypothetical protein [Amorphus orientalis]MDQ0316113.1 hypothetical protein [Amorphus orientalis]